ncbi:discoidin domain-containing protein [Pseudoalteromonas denitrificans]|uniref:F5/8 type C domain-containing protein n=1 Tax=Pseudoalteromonas denitrificans DSM 6059 TaxID=1123010 RepID=A0A1I1TYD6_9GAMM|nr:discoidin domain-containing protein [Pseudoalteromonas denitrificans]SFD63395.1 F5/8 type C domain-containing protein [Pseudoalteromonas denitrificans DSM 6059]
MKNTYVKVFIVLILIFYVTPNYAQSILISTDRIKNIITQSKNSNVHFNQNENFLFNDVTQNAIVVETLASSNNAGWIAQNIVDSTSQTYWMSEINSGNQEWIELKYDKAFAANHVSIVLNNGRQGNTPKIQASTDGEHWVDLATINIFEHPNDEDNFRHISFYFDNNQMYQHYRYVSDPTVFLLLNYLEFMNKKPLTASVTQIASNIRPPWQSMM